MGDCPDKDVSLVDLKVGQAVMLERLTNTQADVEVKHAQNRKSIHDLRVDVQHVIDDVWKLKIKIAGYSAIGGAIAALIGKLIEHIVK